MRPVAPLRATPGPPFPVSPTAARTARAVAVAALATTLAVAALATRDGGAAPAAPPAGELPAERLRLVDPAGPPDAHTVVTIGSPLATVLDRLGPPSAVEPDVDGDSHVWALSARAEVAVRAWPDGAREVNGFVATVGPGEDARLAVDGVVLGRTPLREAVAAWGPPSTPALHDGTDYAVAYDGCAGADPVVVKLDVEGRAGRALPDLAASPLADAPVTTVLVAYADESPALCAAAA